MSCSNKKRLGGTMMFSDAQKPSLIRDPYVYRPDSIMLDLEDAVAEDQRDAARFSLYHAPKTLGYRGCERVVRIDGLGTDLWREDIRCVMADDCDSIRVPKIEYPEDVAAMEKATVAAKKEFDRPKESVLIMTVVESAKGVLESCGICTASERLFGVAPSDEDYTKDLQTNITGAGTELMGTRSQTVIPARAAGVQCFDTVYTDLNNMEGFRKDVEGIYLMGFDGKSIISPRQINIVREIFTPSQKDIAFVQKIVNEIEAKRTQGVGVFAVDGKMIDIAFYDGTRHTLELTKASSVYKEVQ